MYVEACKLSAPYHKAKWRQLWTAMPANCNQNLSTLPIIHRDYSIFSLRSGALLWHVYTVLPREGQRAM